MERSESMQQFVNMLAEKFVIDNDFIASSDHPYSCRCDTCLKWWVRMGPEDEGVNRGWSFGPFTQEEYVAAGGYVPPDSAHYDY